MGTNQEKATALILALIDKALEILSTNKTKGLWYNRIGNVDMGSAI